MQMDYRRLLVEHHIVYPLSVSPTKRKQDKTDRRVVSTVYVTLAVGSKFFSFRHANARLAHTCAMAIQNGKHKNFSDKRNTLINRF